MDETGLNYEQLRQVAIDGLMVLGLVVLITMEWPL
jgi:hypothetical protein